MAARATSSGTISFGLVSIPVKFYTAASSEQVRFNMLHPKSGARLKQQLYSPVDDELVERKDTVKGYEYAKGQYVQFTEDEVKALETARSSSIDIIEFVPLDLVDFVHVEKSYYLGPDKGGDKAYRLLNQSMEVKGKVAIGRWAARGKEQLILIRPYKDGLILHQLYYANEVRNFEDLDRGSEFEFSEKELDLAEKLIEQLAVDAFEPEKFSDEYADRVRAAVDEKVAGKEITIAPEAPKAQIIDLFEALKKSLSGEAEDSEDAEGGGEDSAAKPPKKVAASRKVSKKKTG